MMNVFDLSIEALIQTKNIVNLHEFADIVDAISTHRSWTIGMGKAGMVGHKLSATLACNGRPSAYLHAGECLHGDFGAIQTGDVLIALSNSGKTDEVLQVAHKAKEIGAFLISITSSKTSPLGQISDLCLPYGVIKEACILGLTPTTSIIVMLTICDAIAVAVQSKIGFTYKDYERNHHAGYLGAEVRKKLKIEDTSK